MSKNQAIPTEYFSSQDVVTLAADLLGKFIFTNFNGKLTGGIIIETEAYAGSIDRASHAYGNRRTKRTEPLFQSGGRLYVYLCYGLHYLVNIVTGPAELPHAILLRAVYPTDGIDMIRSRRHNFKLPLEKLMSGPGTLAQGLGLSVQHTNLPLKTHIWIEDRNINFNASEIHSSARIGVEYAGEDAKLPWRFSIDPTVAYSRWQSTTENIV